MTETIPSAHEVARDYVQAWLRGDVETALGFVADDIVCGTPNGVIEGLAGYREFLTPFSSAPLGSDLIDVRADDGHTRRPPTASRLPSPRTTGAWRFRAP